MLTVQFLVDMWSGVTKEFQEGISPWLKNTPLAAVRPGVDSEDLVKGAEVAGGRPVSRVAPCFKNKFRKLTVRESGIRIRNCWCHRYALYS